MRNRRRIRRCVIPWLGLTLLLSTTASLPAAEPVQAFLDGLRRRQMYDMALEYLDRLPQNTLVSEDVKQIIPYERGRTLVEQARADRDVSRRMKQLDEARRSFEQFVADHPEHPLTAAANTELGNVLVERGRARLELARRPSRASRKDQLIAEARQLFKKARTVFEDAEKTFAGELEKYPKHIDPEDRERFEARKQVRENLIRARLLAGLVLYDAAKSFPESSRQRSERLTEAAEKFQQIYNRYRTILAGLVARMWQARCYQDLGDTRRALTYYDELLAQPDEPQEFRSLKRKTLRLVLECWLSEKERKYDRAIEQGRAWLSQARGTDARTVEAFAIRYLTAQALWTRAETLDENDPQKRRDLNAAVDLATDVAKVPGEFQQAAKEAIARLRDAGEETEPATFAEARDRAKAARDTMLVSASGKRIAEKTGQNAERISQLAAEVDTAREESIRYYRLALGLRDADSSLEDVNQVRYFLCFLYYQGGQYYDAAVLGEFLARSYPKSSAALPAAEIAMAAYLMAYNAAPPAERSFETAQMVGVAEYLGGQWPDADETQKARLILGDLAIRSGELDKASEYLSQIPDDSPQRAEADLKNGQALWAAYLKAASLPEVERPSPDVLSEKSAKAQAALEQGVARSRARLEEGGLMNSTLATSELSLVQSYLGTTHFDKAIESLERPGSGPLALVEANDPIAGRGNFAVETYKAALRAYVGVRRLDKAQEMRAALEKSVAGNDQGSRELMQIYLSLGRELKEQVGRLRAEQKTDQLELVLAGYEQFLDEIGKQSNDLSSLIWVAESFYQLGEGLSSDAGGSPPLEARAYYDRAADAYNKALSHVDASDAERTDALKLRLARCRRRQGAYKQALGLLSGLLASRPKMLDAQIEAALLYQAWGRENSTYYTRAVGGYNLNISGGSTVKVWGWNRLAALVQRHRKYRSIYHQARYNLAQCHYELAMSKKATDDKRAALQRAERAIVVTARLDPDMGGDRWIGRYDALLKKIQRELGARRPGGLSAVVREITTLQKTSAPSSP